MVAKADVGPTCDGQVASSSDAAAALDQRTRAGVAAQQVQGSALDVGGAGNVVGRVDVNDARAAQTHGAGGGCCAAIQVVRATAETEHTASGDIEVAGMRAPIVQAQNARLHIHRAGIVERHIHGGAVARAAA